MGAGNQQMAGFLLTGFAGRGNPGYLFVPYNAVGPGPVHSIDPYVFGHAIEQSAIWLPRPGLDTIDQPLRYVRSMTFGQLASGIDATITNVCFSRPRFLTPDLRLTALLESNGKDVSAGAYASPSGIIGVKKDILLEVYRSFDVIDHRPWSLRTSIPETTART